MPTLVLSSWSLPSSRALAAAAQEVGWRSVAFDENPKIKIKERVIFYGGTDLVLSVAATFRLALLEPPFDLLARLPMAFRRRAVEFGRFNDLHRLKAPTFVKPADALNKGFDAGIYANVRDIRVPKGVDARTPVLAAEPVEWLAEYRCFISEKRIVAWSPYISFGRPVWKPFSQGGRDAQMPPSVAAFCDRLLGRSGMKFPTAFVMDVGLIEDRGWAVVEFNPAWCSGVLGADPQGVLTALDQACLDADRVSHDDLRWVLAR